MRVYAAELICSTGVLCFQTSKLALCVCNKAAFTRWNFKLVRLWRHFFLDPTLWGPIDQFWTWVMADREIQVNGLWIKIKAQDFSSQVLSKHFQNLKKKRWRFFFLSQGHFKGTICVGHKKISMRLIACISGHKRLHAYSDDCRLI